MPAIATEKKTTKPTLHVPKTCKCGAAMAKVKQAPSYCGEYFEAECSTGKTWEEWAKHTSFERNGQIEDFKIVYKD